VIQSTVRSDSGREFQTNGPETQNALSPSLERVLEFETSCTLFQLALRECLNIVMCVITAA